MSPRTLLLPVETLNREFDAKLLLALHAAERGWRPVIGKRSTINNHIHQFKEAVYFSKGFRSGNRRLFGIIDDLGHAIVGLDEESLVNPSEEMLLFRLDPGALRRVRIGFAWGENDARILRNADGFDGTPVVATGNPRIDLLRPELAGFLEPEVERIRARFGPFALFNTNFSMVNHFLPGQTRFRAADWVPAEKAQTMKAGLLEHKRRLLEAFLNLIPDLAEALRPNALVIRPHPSENWQLWHDVAQDLDNVHVVHEGTVSPWLAAAGVLIHNGCTSAVEASVLGTPALSFRPVRAPGYDSELPNRLSFEFDDPHALIAEAARRLSNPANDRQALDSSRQALLGAHISGHSGPLASERLLDAIEQNAALLQPATNGCTRAVTWARHQARRLVRRQRPDSKKFSGHPCYLRHKFGKLAIEEIEERIGRFQITLARFDQLRARAMGPKMFEILAG